MARVSVCVPTFNCEDFIVASLRSVLSQNAPQAEIITNDDASSDSTAQLIARIPDSSVVLGLNPARLGLVGNWNRCLELASGDYVCVFHQDDVMLPGFLARATRALDDNPRASFVFANVEIMDAAGRVTGGHWSPAALPARDAVVPGPELLARLCARGNFIPCQTVVMRATAIRAAGPFDARLTYTPDFEMWLRLCLQGDAAYLATPGVRIRRHPAQTSARFIGAREVRELRRAFEIFFSAQRAGIANASALARIAAGHLRDWSRLLARSALRRGRVFSALQLLIESARAGSVARAGMAE
ncbi:MAG: glycosyltransferase [Thermoflexales bacterium]